MGFALPQIVSGLADATPLFLVAAGLSLVFAVTRTVNLAQGAFYMLGAYLAAAELGGLLPGTSFWLVALLAAAVMFSYSIRPGYTSMQQNREALELLKNRMDDQQALQGMIDDRRSDIANIRHAISGESGELHLNEMESYLIGRLQSLSWDSDIQLISVRPGASKRVIDFDEVSFEVSVIGKYFDIYDWLNRLDSNLGFVKVTRYRIQPLTQGAGREDNRLNMELTLVFYRVAP